MTIQPNEKLIIQEEALAAEKLGRLTNKQLSLIYENKWFHLLVPKALGGAEMDLPQFAYFVEELAMVDGSFAWNVNLGAGANMFSGFMEPDLALKLFRNERTCVAGSGAVSGTALKHNDGYIINGSWKYASGSAHANLISLNAILEDDREERYASFLVPADEVQILDTWNVFGMKATSSCDFIVQDVWVPEKYLFDLQTASPTTATSLYRFPFMLLAEINMLVMATGLAIRFLELSKDLATKKILKYNKQETKSYLIDHPDYASSLKKVESLFKEKRKITFDLLDKIWQEIDAEIIVSDNLSSDFSNSVAETADASRQLVDTLYPYAGMNVVFEGSEISRVYRDFKVASQHGILSPAARIR